MESKYLKYKKKYLDLQNKIRKMIGGNIDLRVTNFTHIIELLRGVDEKCINSFIKSENISNELINIERVIGSGVNGEVLLISLKGFAPIAVKTIPISKSDYNNIRSYNEGDLNVVSVLAEMKALELCTSYVLKKKSPHYNIIYKHLVCTNCEYIGDKVLGQTYNDTFDKSHESTLGKIRETNALAENNYRLRQYKIKDVQLFNKISGNIIPQYCVYILNEIADGDMMQLLTKDLSFNDFKIYLFQIFSALNLCYIEDEMSHHDLHCKNILFVNDMYNNTEHDLYNIIIQNDDGTGRESIHVRLPLNGKMLRIWDFGRVNIQGKIHIIGNSYYAETKRERFEKDINKLFNDGSLGLKKNPHINTKAEFIALIDMIHTKYKEAGYFGLMKYMIEQINEINGTCVTERYKYNF